LEEVVVYVDLIFLLNLLIDATTLKTTAWARKISARPWRILAASVIGALYVMMMFFPAMSFMFTFVVKCVFSVLMLLTAFGFGSLQHFLRNFGVFYLVNFAAAGGIFAVHYFMQSSHEVWNGMLFTQSGGLSFQLKIGGLFVVVLFPLLIWLYRTVFMSVKERTDLTHYFAAAEIYLGPHCCSCTGLIDTGNQLYDPLTRTPVMVMEVSSWKDVLPESWINRIQEDDSDEMLRAMGEDQFEWQERLRFVPYKGIHKGAHFMLAIKPDKVVITHNDSTTETEKVFIGLKGSKLSSDGSYQAIIHPTLTKTLRR
jgi:stage II sporulation protein GA (sporulation sigma-E factor processing peptidase)